MTPIKHNKLFTLKIFHQNRIDRNYDLLKEIRNTPLISRPIDYSGLWDRTLSEIRNSYRKINHINQMIQSTTFKIKPREWWRE
jgi:hypothetical protein